MDPSLILTHIPRFQGLPLESKLVTYMTHNKPGMPPTISSTMMPSSVDNIMENMSNMTINVGQKMNAPQDYVDTLQGAVSPSKNSQLNVFSPEYTPKGNVNGTTYFYTPVVEPLIEEVPLQINNSHPLYFMGSDIRQDVLDKNAIALAEHNRPDDPNIPAEVQNYQELMLLEEPRTGPGPVTSTFRATNIKNGNSYCLRRVHDCKLTNKKSLAIIETWKKLLHSNIVGLKEVFFTKAFGDESTVFVYDYFPGSETMLSKHFAPKDVNGYVDPFSADPTAPRPYSHTKNTMLRHQHNNMLPESLIWNYVIQLTAAIRVIHAAGLSYRCLDPSKVLLTSNSRIRLSCVGVPDVVDYKDDTCQFQGEDLLTLGKLVLALASRSLLAVHRTDMQGSLDLISSTYSKDLRNLILYLLSNSAAKSVTDLMPMIGARFYTQLDAIQLQSDAIENELSKELDNGRLFKLISKIASINERPQFNMDPQWSETGDRYMIKLFRDYVFHQVDPNGRPWLDLAHIVSCLNKLDAGSTEQICLMSRDEKTVLIVTYAELKQCMETSFEGLLLESAKE
ncbi:hypothetical protein TKK_0000815 [Trichogramma kaykai]|uniref:PAN2-PAN3 deadenylation complex subunit PAN3 n=1 Tax=Trichogramma kaykai TaxID=54128 RepID=A0ABD2VVN3_9HYME